MLHGVSDLLSHREPLLRLGQVLEGLQSEVMLDNFAASLSSLFHRIYLNHDEHVVYAEAEQEEWDDGRHVRVEEPEVKAESKGAEHGQPDHRHSHQGEKHL